MENLTHSLLGAALAELALPVTATKPERRIFFAAAFVASNFPDADLFYTGVTPAPLGYLLHHRGHSHTLVGLVGQAVLLGLLCLLPIVRRYIGASRVRLLTLIAVSLLGHLVLDSWNSYGVHPFYPFDMQWYYGDAIYIVEPWLWLLLGVAATANARNQHVRTVLGALLAVLAAAFAWFGMMPVGALMALAIAAMVLGWITKQWSPRTRSSAALAATALFVVTMFGAKQVVRGRTLASLHPALGGEIVDVVLNPSPANPLCWNALAIVMDEHAGTYVMTRGTTSLVPGRLAATSCGIPNRSAVAWGDPLHQPLAQLRELSRDDCWVRAWLQFGRAPVLDDSTIADLRFRGASRGNFSSMRLKSREQAVVCPANLTHWGIPRADLLGSVFRQTR